jgi:tetratricopeptide (TPR) repeat protein
LTGHAPGWTGGIAGHGWQGGFPGQAGIGSHSHPYSWYNGNWHNHWYGNGFGGYGGGFGYPLGWGLTGWGTGNLWYNSGYAPYYNPYYASAPGGAGGYDYAQPVPVVSGMLAANGGAIAAVDVGGANPGNPDVEAAVERFQAGDYARALTLIDDAILAQPSDAAAHELRALILFAKNDYSRGAATIHSVLAVGPGWDWTTLSSLYPDMTIYASQLHALEAYVKGHPQQADARFLLAYHYLTQGHTGAAASELQQVVSLMPDDKLAADLLRMMSGKVSASPPAVPPPPGARPAPGPNVPPVDPAALAGQWHASRDDGSTFDLDLADDKTFTWKFAQQQGTGTMSGTYTIDNGLLVLQDQTGGAMVGRVSGGGGRFSFKPLGGPSDDPGLTFTR